MRKFIAVGFLFYLWMLLLTTNAQISSIPTRSTISQAYQTVADEGSNLTQRNKLNFIGSTVSCVDNSGATRTDCTISSAATTGTFRSVITDLDVTATSSVITVNAGVCWNVTKASNMTLTRNSGSGSGTWVAYCNDSGSVVILYSSGAGLSVTQSGLLETAVVTPTIPEGAVALAEGTIVSGFWSTTVTPLRSWSQRVKLLSGTGMDVSCVTGVCTINVDSASVQLKSDPYTPTSAVDFSGTSTSKPMKTGTADPGTCAVGEFLFRTDTGATKACTAVNTWTTIGGSAPTITAAPYWPFGMGSDTGVTLQPGANVQRAYLFVPLANYSFSKIRYRASGTGYVAFAIVTSDGNTIVSNSAARCNNATPGDTNSASCNLAGTVSLTAGTLYYFVFTADATTGIYVTNESAGNLGYASTLGFSTYIGQAANASTGSAGTLAVSVPLGTVSPITGSITGNAPPSIVYVP